MVRVIIDKEVVDMLLAMGRESHPKEFIVLLRGKKSKGELRIEEVVIAPIATMGHGFSSFRLDMMPIDLSIVGSAHSHPSGSSIPSVEDLNNMVGMVSVIVRYPYKDETDVYVYDKEGRPLSFTTS